MAMEEDEEELNSSEITGMESTGLVARTEEILPADGTVIHLDELVDRLSKVNIPMSPEECSILLNSLPEISALNIQAITRSHIVPLIDVLDNRIAFRVLFEKYSTPILNQMTAEQLQTFFRKELEKAKSTRQCRRLICDVNRYETCGLNSKLTLSGFYRLLARETFALFNSVHLKQCQDMSLPLPNYFIATSQHINFPTKEEQKSLQKKYPDIYKTRATLGFDEATLLAKYRDLLLTGYRCLQIRLVWNENRRCLCIPVAISSPDEFTSQILVKLDDFLIEIYWSAFKKSPFPVILQCITSCIDSGKKLLYRAVLNKFQDSLYKPLPKTTKFPSVKALQRKFLVYYIEADESEPSLLTGSLLTSEPTESEGDTENEENIHLESLYDDRHKVHFWDLFSLERSQAMCQIAHSIVQRESERNQWPTMTERNLMALQIDENLASEEKEESRQSQVALNLIRVGVQCIPLAPGNLISRALFRLNGSCGYVVKPKYIRKGMLYKNFSEDKPLKDEPPSRLFLFTVCILCVQDVLPFKGNMATSVTLRILGHEEDAKHSFTTRVCTGDGLVPAWNEQTRFRIRLPDLAFFHLSVYNGGHLLGYYVLPVKAVLRGVRHVPLYDAKHQLIENAKLFLHIGYREIVNAWKPVEPKPKQEEEPAVEIVSIAL